jgi:hypothetical protein
MHARTVLSEYKPNVDLLVLDGIPRNTTQAKLLEKHLNVLKIIHLVCPDKEEMIKRLRRRALKENRIDDAKEEVIRKRWEVYERETFRDIPGAAVLPVEPHCRGQRAGKPGAGPSASAGARGAGAGRAFQQSCDGRAERVRIDDL